MSLCSLLVSSGSGCHRARTRPAAVMTVLFTLLPSWLLAQQPPQPENGIGFTPQDRHCPAWPQPRNTRTCCALTGRTTRRRCSAGPRW